MGHFKAVLTKNIQPIHRAPTPESTETSISEELLEASPEDASAGQNSSESQEFEQDRNEPGMLMN